MVLDSQETFHANDIITLKGSLHLPKHGANWRGYHGDVTYDNIQIYIIILKPYQTTFTW